MKIISKRKNLIIGGIILVLLLSIVGLSYSWFSRMSSGNGNEMVVYTARLGLVYKETNAVSMPNALPGQSITKLFSVENISNEKVSYSIIIKDIVNEFLNDELVYKLYRDDELIVDTTPIAEILLESIEINGSEKHEYKLEITFIETGSNQNHNLGKTFSGRINIIESSSGDLDLALIVDGMTVDSINHLYSYALTNYTCKNNTILTWNSVSKKLELERPNLPDRCTLEYEKIGGGYLRDVTPGSYVSYVGATSCIAECNGPWRLAYVKDGKPHLLHVGVPSETSSRYCNPSFVFDGYCAVSASPLPGSRELLPDDIPLLTEALTGVPLTLASCVATPNNCQNIDLLNIGKNYRLFMGMVGATPYYNYWDGSSKMFVASLAVTMIRPLVILKDNILITGGVGTLASPYTIANFSIE